MKQSLTMVAKLRRLISAIPSLAVTISIVTLFAVNQLLKRRPRPSNAPPVSGVAPGEGGTERPLSDDQLKQLHTWLCLRRQGWHRNIIPPAGSSYVVQLEHSDGTTTFLFFFSRAQSAIYFRYHDKDRRFDAAWLSLPLAEVDDLIALVRA